MKIERSVPRTRNGRIVENGFGSVVSDLEREVTDGERCRWKMVRQGIKRPSSEATSFRASLPSSKSHHPLPRLDWLLLFLFSFFGFFSFFLFSFFSASSLSLSFSFLFRRLLFLFLFSFLFRLLLFLFSFLVADTQLFKRLCPSVRRSVRPFATHFSKSAKTGRI